jgi:hypothetical protein
LSLKTYLIGELSLDPSRDTDGVVAEYVEGYYGRAAAPAVQAYLRLMADSMVGHDVLHDICASPLTPG